MAKRIAGKADEQINFGFDPNWSVGWSTKKILRRTRNVTKSGLHG